MRTVRYILTFCSCLFLSIGLYQFFDKSYFDCLLLSFAIGFFCELQLIAYISYKLEDQINEK